MYRIFCFILFVLVCAVVFAVPGHPAQRYRHVGGGGGGGDEQRIACPNLCGRSYKRVEHLKRHISYECGVEPKYRCHVCQRKFVYNFSMKKHMGIVHKLHVPTEQRSRAPPGHA